MFCHEKLKVYQFSVQFLGAIVLIIRAIPSGNSDVISQLRRAAMSITLNIAEGAGKTRENDKRRFYSIARGSALECAAIIDLLKTWQLVPLELVSKPVELLEQIAAMLAVLSFRK